MREREPTLKGSIALTKPVSDTPDPTVDFTVSALQGRALDAISANHTLEEILLADGFTPEEIENKKLELSELSKKVVGNSNSQREMEDRLSGELSRLRTIPNLIKPSEAFEVVPALLNLDQFPFNLEQWLTKVMEIDKEWTRTKPALRYLELWIDKVSPEKGEFILRRCLETDETAAYQYFTLYADKIIRILQNMPDFLREIWQLIEEEDYLKLLSRLPASEFPKELKDKLAIWTPPESQIQVSTKIRSVRHVDNYTGDCPVLESTHNATLLDPDYKLFGEELYGDVVIIFVDNVPVGSMKMWRQRSLIGLRNFRDLAGRLPLVKGGVYTTNKAITLAAEAAFKAQGKWARLDVEDLPLLPTRLIGTDDGGFSEYAQYMAGLDHTVSTQRIFSA